MIVSLLAVPFFAGEVKADPHETVDIKVDSANAYILVTNLDDSSQQAGYTSMVTSTTSYPGDDGSNVYASVISPQEVQLFDDSGFEGYHTFSVQDSALQVEVLH